MVRVVEGRKATRPSASATVRGVELVLPFVVIIVAWQAIVMTGVFPRALMPPVPAIARAGWGLVVSGTLLKHLLSSVARLLVGFAIGAVAGVALGLAMGLSGRLERFFLPLMNLALPIPSIAIVPLMVLWFGLGNLAVVVLVAFVASLQVAFNTWTGVKTTNELLIRVGRSMNAPRSMIVLRIVLPAAMPFILTGLRLGLARGWIGTIAGEMVSSSNWGLGWMIFNALQFLQTSTMLVGLLTIGLVGYAIEKIIFQPIEKRTVVRWGVLSGKAGAAE